MQTFLPHPGFVQSAHALDDRRLGKQRVETFQILRALVWPTYGWKRHPAVTMWRGFTPAVVAYGIATCRVWAARGHADALEEQLLAYSGGVSHTFAELNAEGRLPPWLGDDRVHESHRRSLANKAPDLYPPDWAGEAGYVWPTPAYPLWPLPLPEATDTPTRIVGALTDAGVPAATLLEPGTPVWDALRALHRGDCAAVGSADPTVVLAASRVRPGLTACLLEQDEPTDEPLPDASSEKGGTVSASVAREPSAEDRAAMAAEASDPARIRYFRRGQTVPEPSRFGLVVTTGTTVPPELASVPTLTVPPPHPEVQ